MTEFVDYEWRLATERSQARLVADAPSDHDEVMAQVRPLPLRLSLVLVIGLSAASWAAGLGLARLLL